MERQDQLGSNAALIDDAGWRDQARAAMHGIVRAAETLQIEPVPESVAQVAALMDKVAAHARAMEQDYGDALVARNATVMRSMKNHSTRMFTYILQAQKLIPR